MSTNNPRVHVTLPPSLHDLVGKMARAQRVSRSQVLRELLEAAEPALQRVVALMEAAERAKGAVREEFGDSLLRSQELIEAQLAQQLASVEGVTGDLVTMAERIEGRRPPRRPASRGEAAGAGASTTPVPVTRGSGTPMEGGRKARKEGGQASKVARKGVSRGRV